MSRATFFFQDETERVLKDWDGHIYMTAVKDTTDRMELTAPLPCGDGYVPKGFQWNGATVGPLRHCPIIGFPKWKHPIATCRHDFRCGLAMTFEERLIADRLFRRDVGIRGTRWERLKGYIGVRIGAYFSILF